VNRDEAWLFFISYMRACGAPDSDIAEGWVREAYDRQGLEVFSGRAFLRLMDAVALEHLS
jgi:hypothetical protein